MVVALLLAMTASAFALQPTGNGIVPSLVTGNPPLCREFKIDPVPTGASSHTFTVDGEEVTVEINVYETAAGWKMDFQVLGGYVAYQVVAKGSNAAYIYDYRPDGAASDTGLYCPVAGRSGKYAAFSHIDFCFGTGGGGGAKGVLTGSKWYDLDMDGVWDDTEVGIQGWKISLYRADAAGVYEWVADAYTNADGGYTFADLDPGTYRIVEGAVAGCWVQTYPYDPNFYDEIVLTGSVRVEELDFGNVCVRTVKGYTMGFWSNKNGGAAIDAYLRGGGVIAPFGIPMTKAEVQALFRKAASAVDMCVMLEAQYVAHWLNTHVPVGGVVADYSGAVVLIGGTPYDYDSVMADFAAFNCATATRQQAEWYKDFFDGLNNNWFKVVERPGVCPVPVW
jgi:hypothetical protein